MEDIHDFLFGPLNKDYCMIFYVFMVIDFVLLCLLTITLLGSLTSKKVSIEQIIGGIVGLSLYSMNYFTNRSYILCA